MLSLARNMTKYKTNFTPKHSLVVSVPVRSLHLVIVNKSRGELLWGKEPTKAFCKLLAGIKGEIKQYCVRPKYLFTLCCADAYPKKSLKSKASLKVTWFFTEQRGLTWQSSNTLQTQAPEEICNGIIFNLYKVTCGAFVKISSKLLQMDQKQL